MERNQLAGTLFILALFFSSCVFVGLYVINDAKKRWDELVPHQEYRPPHGTGVTLTFCVIMAVGLWVAFACIS